MLSDASYHKPINWHLARSLTTLALATDRYPMQQFPYDQTRAFGSQAGPTFSQN